MEENTGSVQIESSLPSRRVSPLLRWILLLSGSAFVGLGVLGIFLPLLPTTVFFLLAAWCYARSSQTLYNWLHTNRLFGSYIRNYREGRGITLNSKVTSILVLWVGISYSIVEGTDNLLVRLILLAIAIGVTIHLLMIPTYKTPKV